jgi:hypothetical protein
MPVIPALGRLRQESHKLKANLAYTASPVSIKERKQGKQGGKKTSL